MLITSNDTQTTRKLHRAIHQILLLRLTHTEIACLKTLTLFRPGKLILYVMFCCVYRLLLLCGRSWKDLFFTCRRRVHFGRFGQWMILLSEWTLEEKNRFLSTFIACFLVLFCLFFFSSFRLCRIDIAIWNCNATRRNIESIIRNVRRHTNGTYFINIAAYSCSRWSKGYSGIPLCR